MVKPGERKESRREREEIRRAHAAGPAQCPGRGAVPGGPPRSSGCHRWQGRRFAEDGRLSAGCAVQDRRAARRRAHRSARMRMGWGGGGRQAPGRRRATDRLPASPLLIWVVAPTFSMAKRNEMRGFPGKVRVAASKPCTGLLRCSKDDLPPFRSGRQAMTVPSLTGAGAPPSRRVKAGAGKAGRGHGPRPLSVPVVMGSACQRFAGGCSVFQRDGGSSSNPVTGTSSACARRSSTSRVGLRKPRSMPLT